MTDHVEGANDVDQQDSRREWAFQVPLPGNNHIHALLLFTIKDVSFKKGSMLLGEIEHRTTSKNAQIYDGAVCKVFFFQYIVSLIGIIGVVS